MTIKELESRTGMTRANIRFYEGEGLLAPRRLDNGYRDYSEEDARTLEKIKLLRQLQLDIDTIRKVQQGALTLEQALFTQTTKLEGDKAVIERAAQVCRELERSGVEYAALEPQPWLGRLQEPARPGLPEPPAVPAEDERDDEPRACYCPWQRLFARSLDILLYDTVINVAWMLLSRDVSFVYFQKSNAITEWFFGLLSLAFALALESVWLHYWGWTPGKWVFGLKLRDEDGDKLTIGQGLWRGFAVLKDGCGWNIPVWNLWKMWQGRKLGLDGQDCAWDDDEGYRYTKEERRIGGWIYVAANIVCVAALVLSMLWCSLPPCRGNLTMEEFARNYNHFRSQVMWGSELPRLDKDGRWREQADGNGYGGTVQTQVDGVWMDLEEPVWDEPEFTLEDGHVTAVTLRVSGGCIDYLPSVQREMLMLLALSGSTENWSLLDPDVDGWLTAADEVLDQFGDGETQQRGLRVTKQEELSGYQETEEFFFLTPVVGEEQRYERVVTISLVQ